MAKIDYGDLAARIQECRYVMRIPRRNRVDLAREVAGHRYAEGGTQHSVKVNFLALAQTVIGGSLIANDPRYLLTSYGGAPRSAVRTEQDWLNEQVKRIRFADTLRRWVIDALYLHGILKVGITTPCDAATSAWGVSAGEPGAWVVDPDDWVFDVNAKDQSAFEFEGHRYNCPVEVAMKMYGSKVKTLGDDDWERDYNREGDERIGRITRGMQRVGELEPYIQLYEIYLPRHRKVVVLPARGVASGEDTKPLWEHKWVGHDDGPYVHMGLGTVPGQALAKGPMADWYEAHADFNNVARKLNNMVRRIKEVTVFERKDDADAKALQEANDGDFVPVERPESLVNVVSGGKAIAVMQVVLSLYKELFDFVSNLSLVGGRQSMAKTATQEKILNDNAGAGMAVMSRTVQAAVARAGERLLFLSHYHPDLKMESQHKLASGYAVRRRLKPPGQPGGRNWDFKRMDLRLDPYSLGHKSPEERLAFINQTVQTVLPIMPMLQQQGITFDASVWMQYIAELGDEPRISEMFTVRPPPGGDSPGSGGASETPHTQTLPANTQRTYTRESVPQQQGGTSQQLLARMSGVDVGGAREPKGVGV